MVDARAEWLSNEPTGPALSLSDLLPPSSRQDLISTLPGITPSTPAPYSAPYSSRSTVETLEYSQPVPHPPQITATETSDEQRTEWCVDFGSVLTTMETFELWTAIDRGEVLRWMRVWREGMECWTPVGEVSELALAFQTPPSSSSRTPEPIILPPPLESLAPGEAPTLSRPQHPSLPDEGRPPADTLVSGQRQPSLEQISHTFLPAPIFRRAGAHFWAALGSAVAATVISAAIISAEPPRAPLRAEDLGAAVPPSEPTLVSGAAAPLEATALSIAAAASEAPAPSIAAVPPASAAAPLDAPEPPAAVAVPPSSVPAVASSVPAVPRAPGSKRDPHAVPPRARHDENGQRRLRRSSISGNRLYGW
jgi:hypothetical protein